MSSKHNLLPTGAFLATALLAAGAIKACQEQNDSAEVQITPGSTIESIRPSDAIPLLDIGGHASASASDTIKVPSIVPFLGGNKVPGTKATSDSTVNGIVEVRTKGMDAIKTSLYTVPGSATAKVPQQRIMATVNTDRLYMRASLDTLFVDGRPQTNEHHEPFSVFKLNSVLKRGAIATEAAKLHFQSSCGKEVLPALYGGVIKYTKNGAETAARIVEKLPNGAPSAEVVRQTARQPIKVVFKQGNKPDSPEIDPSQIALRYQDMATKGSPIRPLNSEAEALKTVIGQNNVHVTTGKPCTLEFGALKQFQDLQRENVRLPTY